MKLVILGPPGAGKGTYSGEIKNRYNIAHIEAGRLLRQEISNQTETGKNIKEIVDHGKLVPDNIIIELIENRLRQDDAENGFILDGFPRTINQAQALDNITDIELVIELFVPREILIEKILARRTCKQCGAIYNIADIDREIDGVHYELPPLSPEKEGVCDKCGGELIRRSDETPEILEQRFATYDEQTKPLVEYYEKKSLLRKIHVTHGKEIMLEKIFELIEKELGM